MLISYIPLCCFFTFALHYCFKSLVAIIHKRRINPEERAKVVASVWGEEFVQLLAALAVLPFLSNHPGAIHPLFKIALGKTASAARN